MHPRQRVAAHRVRARFTQQMLIAYAAAVGMHPFDPDFYAPDQKATLITHTEPPRPDAYQTDLAGARSGRTLEDVGWPAKSQN